MKDLIEQIEADAPPQTKTIADLAEESYIPQGVSIPEPELIFALNKIPVFTKKSLSVLKGIAKSGKTTVTSWISAHVIKNNLNVLWIDTEQGLYYGSKIQFFILKMAGVINSENLSFHDVKIHNPVIRIQIIEHLIKTTQPDLIVIDGIRDLVFDINNPEEATIITGDLMRWAEEFDCHVMSIIHENKSGGHARGHLGSEMINKSETVLKVSNNEDGLIVCEPEFSRGEPFEPFAFGRDSYGMPVLMSYEQAVSTGESNYKKKNAIDFDPSVHHEMLRIAFDNENAMSYGDLQLSLISAFTTINYDYGINKIKVFITWYTQNGYLNKLEKTSNKTYYEIKK